MNAYEIAEAIAESAKGGRIGARCTSVERPHMVHEGKVSATRLMQGPVAFALEIEGNRRYKVSVELLREGAASTANAVEAVRRLLRYSWEPIGYTYEKLTDEERKAIKQDEFDELVQWVKAGD